MAKLCVKYNVLHVVIKLEGELVAEMLSELALQSNLVLRHIPQAVDLFVFCNAKLEGAEYSLLDNMSIDIIFLLCVLISVFCMFAAGPDLPHWQSCAVVRWCGIARSISRAISIACRS